MDIIKKIAAIILVAALCLGGAALAEETPEVTPGDFLDEWVDLDGTCRIEIAEHMAEESVDGYVVNVHMPVIAEESYSYVTWAYGCVWDDETQTLKSISRVTGKGDYEPDSEEEITDINYEYSDTAFYFKDGMLIWDDKNETADDGLRFMRPIGWGEVRNGNTAASITMRTIRWFPCPLAPARRSCMTKTANRPPRLKSITTGKPFSPWMKRES